MGALARPAQLADAQLSVNRPDGQRVALLPSQRGPILHRNVSFPAFCSVVNRPHCTPSRVYFLLDRRIRWGDRRKRIASPRRAWQPGALHVDNRNGWRGSTGALLPVGKIVLSCPSPLASGVPAHTGEVVTHRLAVVQPPAALSRHRAQANGCNVCSRSAQLFPTGICTGLPERAAASWARRCARRRCARRRCARRIAKPTACTVRGGSSCGRQRCCIIEDAEVAQRYSVERGA